MTRLSRLVVAGAVIAGAVAALLKLSGFLAAPVRADAGVPVTIVRAARRDATPVLSNIATVQPFNSVLIRSQVDGQISRVAFIEGTEVKRGDVLVELDRRPFEAQVRAAQAQRSRDVAQLDNWGRDLKRYQTLVDDDAGVVQTLDAARAQVAQFKAAVALDQAQIDAARLQLTYATITAPIDGRTGARLVDTGNLVHAADSTGLVILTQIHPIALTFSLPQDTLAQVRAQQAGHALRVQAKAANSDQVLDIGELTLIDNQIDAGTGTYRCKAVMPNAREQLWPGQFVTARVLLDVQPQAVVVPAAAVQEGPGGPYVYVVGSDRKAKLQPVGVSQLLEGQAVISRGLNGDESVVIEGQFQLEPGSPVSLVPAVPPPAHAEPGQG